MRDVKSSEIFQQQQGAFRHQVHDLTPFASSILAKVLSSARSHTFETMIKTASFDVHVTVQHDKFV